MLGRGKTTRYYGQFTHVALKTQLPHVSAEMCGPPSMELPEKPIGTQRESSSV